MKKVVCLFVRILGLSLMGAELAYAEGKGKEQVVIDSIVASVDGQPITLRDVSRKAGRPISLAAVKTDSDVKSALDFLIEEQVVRLESEARHLSVTGDEVESYIREVASRNDISVEEVRGMVEKGGKRFDDYRKEVELDILKSKLASSVLRGSVSVSDTDIAEYLGEHRLAVGGGQARNKLASGSVDLGHLVIPTEGRSSDELEKLLEEISERLDDDEDFEEIAPDFRGVTVTESSGMVAESDLSDDILKAIDGLDESEVSKPVRIGDGIRIFRVNERADGESEDEEDRGHLAGESDTEGVSHDRREEVRAIIEQQRMQERMAGFFSEEIMKKHSVDRKF